MFGRIRFDIDCAGKRRSIVFVQPPPRWLPHFDSAFQVASHSALWDFPFPHWRDFPTLALPPTAPPLPSERHFRSRNFSLGILVAWNRSNARFAIEMSRVVNVGFLYFMYPEYAIRQVLPHVMYALALSLFAVLVLNVFFTGKRRRRRKSPLH